MTNKTVSQITYDELAPFYRAVSEEKFNYLLAIDKLILPFIRGKQSIIDLGSADGVRIINLSQKAKIKNITLIDNSLEMVKHIKKTKELSIKNCSIVDVKTESKFGVVTCLWNVLGHLESISDMKDTIQNVDKNLLQTNGLFILDVNNKYNALSYGFTRTIKNIFLDIIFPKKNQFAEFYKNISNKKIKMRVHFFTPFEIERYLKNSSLKIFKKIYVNYNSGATEKFFWRGQIFYILKKYE